MRRRPNTKVPLGSPTGTALFGSGLGRRRPSRKPSRCNRPSSHDGRLLMTHQPLSQEDRPLPDPEGERSLPHVPETDGPEQAQAHRHLQAEFRQDRLPTPADLREPDDILPGAADRILALAEERLHQAGRAQDQNHTESMALLQSRQQLVRSVQWMAFVVALLLVMVLLILATAGLLESTTSWSIAVAVGVLAVVVGRFLWNLGRRYARSRRREGRQTDAMHPPQASNLIA